MNLIKLPIGKNAPQVVNAIVEIPKDSNAKYEYNPDLNMFVLDRCLISSMRYPASYGFIPQTLSDDGDPLDILVYNTVPIITGTLVECRIVGGLLTIDNGVVDYKVLGIPMYNPNKYEDITDIDEVFLDVTADFFTPRNIVLILVILLVYLQFRILVSKFLDQRSSSSICFIFNITANVLYGEF